MRSDLVFAEPTIVLIRLKLRSGSPPWLLARWSANRPFCDELRSVPPRDEYGEPQRARRSIGISFYGKVGSRIDWKVARKWVDGDDGHLIFSRSQGDTYRSPNGERENAKEAGL